MRTEISMIAAPAAAMTLIKGALLASVLLTFAPAAFAAYAEQGHDTLCDALRFPARAVDRDSRARLRDSAGSGRHHGKHEGREDARQDVGALHRAQRRLGPKKYIDGACVLADADGDKIFSTFDTRDLDKSQPELDCGTHIITGGTGKYAGITGSEPFDCVAMPNLAGAGGYTAMDIPHNTSWEIKK